MDGDVERTIEAIRSGRPVLFPTDTVYGLVTSAFREEGALELYRVKGRDVSQPTALLAASVAVLIDTVPELRGPSAVIAELLLPGPYTLVLPNPARRFRWLSGVRPDTIGVRVAELSDGAQQVLDDVGAVMATSANDPGGPNPASLDDVPRRIRDACAAELDAGRLPGTPSTVIDFSGGEPHVIRDGVAPAAEALARVREALAG